MASQDERDYSEEQFNRALLETGDEDCPICRPLACDDPDRHLGVPSKYTPLANAGCHCGAYLDGRDCMCFE
jgi:hypothetical protein